MVGHAGCVSNTSNIVTSAFANSRKWNLSDSRTFSCTIPTSFILAHREHLAHEKPSQHTVRLIVLYSSESQVRPHQLHSCYSRILEG